MCCTKRPGGEQLVHQFSQFPCREKQKRLIHLCVRKAVQEWKRLFLLLNLMRYRNSFVSTFFFFFKLKFLFNLFLVQCIMLFFYLMLLTQSSQTSWWGSCSTWLFPLTCAPGYMDFFTTCPQSVRLDLLHPHSQHWLTPLLYSLCTHDCAPSHSTNSLINFADDDATVLSFVAGGDESVCYRDETQKMVLSSKNKRTDPGL